MFEGVLKSILHKYLKNFLIIDQNQLKLSIWSGNVEATNIKFQ